MSNWGGSRHFRSLRFLCRGNIDDGTFGLLGHIDKRWERAGDTFSCNRWSRDFLGKKWGDCREEEW